MADTNKSRVSILHTEAVAQELDPEPLKDPSPVPVVEFMSPLGFAIGEETRGPVSLGGDNKREDLFPAAVS